MQEASPYPKSVVSLEYFYHMNTGLHGLPEKVAESVQECVLVRLGAYVRLAAFLHAINRTDAYVDVIKTIVMTGAYVDVIKTAKDNSHRVSQPKTISLYFFTQIVHFHLWA